MFIIIIPYFIFILVLEEKKLFIYIKSVAATMKCFPNQTFVCVRPPL